MKLSIHPLFFLFVALSVFGGFWGIAAALLAAVLLHEYSHAIAARSFGVRTHQIRLLPFGAQVEIDAALLPTHKRVIILLSGSLGNIAAALLIGGLLWTFPNLFLLWEVLIIANALPAILNLLPIYPFDGGKIIETLFGPRVAKINRFISAAIFLALTIIGAVTTNPQLTILGAMIFIMIAIELRPTHCSQTLDQALSQLKRK